MLGVHGLPEVGVLVAGAVVEDEDARRLAGCAVELGQPEGGDRAAESRPNDADVEALGHWS